MRSIAIFSRRRAGGLGVRGGGLGEARGLGAGALQQRPRLRDRRLARPGRVGQHRLRLTPQPAGFVQFRAVTAPRACRASRPAPSTARAEQHEEDDERDGDPGARVGEEALFCIDGPPLFRARGEHAADRRGTASRSIGAPISRRDDDVGGVDRDLLERAVAPPARACRDALLGAAIWASSLALSAAACASAAALAAATAPAISRLRPGMRLPRRPRSVRPPPRRPAPWPRAPRPGRRRCAGPHLQHRRRPAAAPSATAAGRARGR